MPSKSLPRLAPLSTLQRRQFLRGTALLPLAAWQPADTAAAGVNAREILIGQSITLQAGKNEYGAAVMDGIKACLGEVNSTGGVHRRLITVRTLDDNDSAVQAEANARQLAADGVFLLFASIEGGPSTAVMKAAVDANLPFFGPMAGSPGLRRPHQALVYPVRAEHREEFRELMKYGKERGMSTVGFLHSDTEVGRAHLDNVRLIAGELGMKVVAALATKSPVDDAQIDAMVARIAAAKPQLMFNHGSAGIYERLIRKARAAQVPTAFMAINSGSTQLAKKLGPLAVGMVFTQVVPSPTARKTQLTRDYQDSFRKSWPDKPFSYGSLEGWLTTRALVAALTATGPNPTHQRLQASLYAAALDVSGLTLRYAPGDHRGSSFVDLAIVTRDLAFMH